MKKYDKMHMELSKEYNECLATGRYEESVLLLERMIQIAEEEGRTNDKKRLEEVRDSIVEYIKKTKMYNINSGNNNGNARKLTQEPQQLAKDVQKRSLVSCG